MNTDTTLGFFDHSAKTLHEMLADVPEDQWAQQPGVLNHPAWTLGHLCCGLELGIVGFGKTTGLDPAWLETMNMGTIPVADRSVYPATDAMWEQFDKGHMLLKEAVRKADKSVFDAPFPVKEYRSFFPTVGVAVFYILAIHETDHIGQLKAWKRAAGLLAAT